MKNTTIGIGKISDTKIQVPVTKDQPGVGSCPLTKLNDQSGETGGFLITFT